MADETESTIIALLHEKRSDISDMKQKLEKLEKLESGQKTIGRR